MPGHPEYPSQHGCFTAAFSDTLAAALHTNHIDVTMPGGQGGSTVLTTTQHFDTVDDVQNQVVDARVWLGFHYRNSVEQGEKLGNDVADWELERFFQPVGRIGERGLREEARPPFAGRRRLLTAKSACLVHELRRLEHRHLHLRGAAMTPTMIPTPIIMIGSMIEVRAATAVSTSSWSKYAIFDSILSSYSVSSPIFTIWLTIEEKTSCSTSVCCTIRAPS